MRTSANMGQAKAPLRAALASCCKEMIWRYLIKYSPAKTPICIYGSRRSGSTLLMQMIGVNRGVMFSDQPFGLYTASSANINRLPIFPCGQIAFPDEEEQAILRSYIEGLFSGQIRANIPWKFWTKDFHFVNDRICLKITDAKAMADWIDTHFDVQTVVLTRHPIAQAVSVASNRWLTTGKGFLRNDGFVERWLTGELEAFCWDIYRDGSDLERRVTDWSLENLPLLSLLPERPHWLYLGHEDVVADTIAAVDYLSHRLELPNRHAMVKRAGRPSRSTKRESTAETRQLIHRQDRERLLNSWREKVSDEDLNACFRVLDQFCIDVYKPSSAMPDHKSVGRNRYQMTQDEARQ